MNQNQIIKGTILCLITVLSWGGQFPIAGSALKRIDPFSFTAMRYTAVMVIFVILLALIEGIHTLRFEGKAGSLWIYGTIGFAGYNFLMFWGQKMAGSSGAILASIILGLMPLISILIIWVFKKNRPHNFTLGCMLVGLIGTLLVVTKGDIEVFISAGSNLIPLCWMLLGVICWIVYTLGASQFTGWTPLRYTTLSCVLGTISTVIIVVVSTMMGYLATPSFTLVMDIGWELGYMIVFAGVLAVFCWNAGNKALTPSNGVLFINIVPVTTFTISILQGYKLTTVELIGALITIGSLIMNNLYQRKITKKSIAKVEHCTARHEVVKN